MKILKNAWLWFAVFCIALYFVTTWFLGVASVWANKGIDISLDSMPVTLQVVESTGNQLTAPPRFVQGSGNIIQPELTNLPFVGVVNE